jgi:hypothetical protein
MDVGPNTTSSGMFRLKPIADKSALSAALDGGELASGEAGAR